MIDLQNHLDISSEMLYSEKDSHCNNDTMNSTCSEHPRQKILLHESKRIHAGLGIGLSNKIMLNLSYVLIPAVG
jgi:hypothetical protein